MVSFLYPATTFWLPTLRFSYMLNIIRHELLYPWSYTTNLVRQITSDELPTKIVLKRYKCGGDFVILSVQYK
jgi:hypothetical protein